jgi:polysaccharide export outer membrane protein
MHPRLLLPTLMCALALLAGCSTAPKWDVSTGITELLSAQVADGSPAATADPTGLARLDPGARPLYRLGPQDEVTITVWGPREVWSEVTVQTGQLQRALTVQDDGTIVLPLLRRVKIDGLTMNEALARITEGYRNVVGSRFQVDGSLTRQRSRPVLIEGAVARPGVAYIGPDLLTVGEAITAAAGGLTDAADPQRGLLYRNGQAYRLDYQQSQQGNGSVHRIELQAGDRLFFPSRSTGNFYVFGEVFNPGSFPIPSGGVTLLQALAQAKGPVAPNANQQSIFLVRPGSEQPRIYRLSLEQIIATRDLPLVPGDRLFVPSTGLTDWERTLRQALPILGAGSVITTTATN